MTVPIRQALHEDLHAVGLGEGIACDYHQRPKEIESDEPVLIEAIRLVDHPQLDDLPDGWVIDAARCEAHTVSEIREPTRGYEEALVQLPVTESNNVVSISTPEVDTVRVLDFSPANEGLHPLVVDQQLMTATEPDDHGLSRWTRVIGMLDAEPPEPLREHLESLIEDVLANRARQRGPETSPLRTNRLQPVSNPVTVWLGTMKIEKRLGCPSNRHRLLPTR
jgi:hypothetical protein